MVAAKPGDDEAHKYILDAIKKTPTSIKRWVTGGDKLVEYAGWFFPEPQIKADAVYSEYIDSLGRRCEPQGSRRDRALLG